MNPYLKRSQQRNIGDSGRKSEKRVAKETGGRLRPGSGNQSHSKGDIKIVKNDMAFLAEAKSTTSDSLSLKMEWLLKIQAEALANGAKPMLTISFVDTEGKKRGLKEDWVCIPLSCFLELTEE